MPQTLLLSTTDRNCRPILHKFQPQRGKEYTIHSTLYTYTVHTFSWPHLSFVAESTANGPRSGKDPYHCLPLPHLHIYISLGGTYCLSLLPFKGHPTVAKSLHNPFVCPLTKFSKTVHMLKGLSHEVVFVFWREWIIIGIKMYSPQLRSKLLKYNFLGF
jgi:hypothetical protein